MGLFGLMRLGWVEDNLLTPLAQIQQQVADQLTGAHTDLLVFNASCSGGDPMALCAGAVLAYPAAWGARLRGAALGLLAIVLLNVVRIGNLSLVAADNDLFQLLHIYVWPGILILATACYVFAWMNRQGRAAPAGGATGGAGGIVLGAAARRFMLLAAALVVVYFATAPFFYESAFVDVVARWIAATGGAILTAAGTTTAVSGAVILTVHGGFRVTQECIFTPLIPLYVAGMLCAPLAPWRRGLALAATPAVFFALGVSRLLVLAVPAAVIGSYSIAVHAFSQVLAAVILVSVAAVYAAGPAAGARAAATRAVLALGVGIAAALAGAPLWGAHCSPMRRPACRRWSATPAIRSWTTRAPGCWFPRANWACSPRCGPPWRDAADGLAPCSASAPWPWPRPSSRFPSGSSPTTTASTRTPA